MKHDRRHQIEILKKVTTSNGFGQPIDEWINILHCWASFEPILGNQYFSAEQIQSGVKIKFETEYMNGISRNMRVKHDNKLYDIIDSINVFGLNRDLILYCKEVVL
jgi:SPP1 family predicted phage head-tail adaptor